MVPSSWVIPAEWTAWTMVACIPATSTVPPLLKPVTSQPLPPEVDRDLELGERRARRSCVIAATASAAALGDVVEVAVRDEDPVDVRGAAGSFMSSGQAGLPSSQVSIRRRLPSDVSQSHVPWPSQVTAFPLRSMVPLRGGGRHRELMG